MTSSVDQKRSSCFHREMRLSWKRERLEPGREGNKSTWERKKRHDDPPQRRFQSRKEPTQQNPCVVLERLQAESSSKGVRDSKEGDRDGRRCSRSGIASQTFSPRKSKVGPALYGKEGEVVGAERVRTFQRVGSRPAENEGA